MYRTTERTSVHRTTDDDTIKIGELGVRFLVEAEDSNGSASVFECYVPADSRMPATLVPPRIRPRSVR
jgi:hypothetical protein